MLSLDGERPALSGSLDEKSPARILFQLAVEERTGLLVFQRDDTEKQIYLQQGDPEFIASNLPDKHLAWRLVQDHVDPKLLFAGTEFGVFFTVDGGKNWVGLTGGAPTISFRDLAIQTRENDLVAGSFGRGIWILDDYTPLRGIDATALEQDPASRFALFYGNRKQNTTMFIEDLYALKNRFPERLQLHFLFSQEEQEFEIAGGRLDAEKIGELLRLFCGGVDIDAAWVCGPGAMIETATAALVDFGMAPDAVHAERFGAPRRSAESPDAPPVETGERTEVTVIMDGHRKTFAMPRSGSSIVDAAAAQGVELPYSCKGGVCATCRTHLRKGEVTMAVNYGLEPWEVEQGFVLACQSTPLSDEILLDYDKS